MRECLLSWSPQSIDYRQRDSAIIVKVGDGGTATRTASSVLGAGWQGGGSARKNLKFNRSARPHIDPNQYAFGLFQHNPPNGKQGVQRCLSLDCWLGGSADFESSRRGFFIFMSSPATLIAGFGGVGEVMCS